MKLLPLTALLLAASPAFAQSSRVYTNADLGHSSVTWTRSVTPEELAGLTDRQFVYIPPRPVRPAQCRRVFESDGGPVWRIDPESSDDAPGWDVAF